MPTIEIELRAKPVIGAPYDVLWSATQAAPSDGSFLTLAPVLPKEREDSFLVLRLRGVDGITRAVLAEPVTGDAPARPIPAGTPGVIGAGTEVQHDYHPGLAVVIWADGAPDPFSG